MDINLLILNGYGQFVWPAFIFTFLSCFLLYLKTKKTLIKKEKFFFNNFKQVKVLKVQTVSKKSTKKILSESTVF